MSRALGAIAGAAVLIVIGRLVFNGIGQARVSGQATATVEVATATAGTKDTATARAMAATATSMAGEVAAAQPDRARQATVAAADREATATVLAQSSVVVVSSQPGSTQSPSPAAQATVAAAAAQSSAAVDQLDRALQQAVAHRDDDQVGQTYLALTDALIQAHSVLANAPAPWAKAADQVVVAMFGAYNRRDLDVLIRLQTELDKLT